MNRDILFRGKCVDGGRWVYGSYVSQYGAHEIVCQNGSDTDGFESRHVRPETICQYTGLTDKKGKKIFEGDILRVAYSPKNDCIIEWHDGSFRLRWVNEDKRAEYGFAYDAVCCVQNIVGKRNIVGNVFETKNL